MILGRATNMWTGLITAADTLLITIIGVTQTAEVTQQWAVILGAIGVFLGFLVLFIANQPPTLNPGDTFHIATPAGTPNTVGVVTPPNPVTVTAPGGPT